MLRRRSRGYTARDERKQPLGRAAASFRGVGALPALAQPLKHASPVRPTVARALLDYLTDLRPSQRVLWCYLLWYLFVVWRYFDASPSLWLSSLGISAIIGVALYLSTSRAGRTPVHLGRWQVARLFMMPFGVSSYAALIKGHGFVLVFHPRWRDNLLAASACAFFVAGTLALRRLRMWPDRGRAGTG